MCLCRFEKLFSITMNACVRRLSPKIGALTSFLMILAFSKAVCCLLSSFIVFNLLLDFIKPLDKLGYRMKKPAEVQWMRKAYANDLTLIASRVQDVQKILHLMVIWLNWSRTMKAKPKKCRALAAKLFLDSEQKMQWS